MKALTKKVKTGKISGFNIKRTSSVFNERPEPYLKILEDENELLTEADMMRIFRVNRVTLYRWRLKGILPFLKVSRNVYYLKQQICEILLAKSSVLIES
ncbi:helix-turn-helix domain-containing protein [Aequorivita capsosiphonis]|uniref:helix-turn-helix domain-containing protein n=1 Tax=Aequorivita capsosiphonis TaxID=487317 RepID=UPI00042499FC|nr:helix-turn-helix domain-containing protein [Aequorivita capsosiphonis]